MAISYGASGGEISWYKETLRNWKYYDDAHPDAAVGPNVYGWDLYEAVAKLQSDYGVPITGSIDDATAVLMDQLAHGIDPRRISDGPGATPQPGGMSAVPYTPGGGLPGGVTPPTVRNATTRIRETLRLWGLESLTDWAAGLLKQDATDDEIYVELYQRPEFKARFPVIEMRHSKKLTPITPAEVMAYERSTRELFRRAGITSEAFTSIDYIQKTLLANDVSAAELGSRLEKGYMRVTQAPAEVRAAFGSYFGTQGDAALMELFLDPDNAAPELERKAMTAYAGGIGTRFGVNVGQAIARDIVDTGASEAEVWRGFGAIDQLQSVFTESISETTDLSAENEGVAAAFGTRPGGERSLGDRVASRRSVFGGGGGAASASEGVVGLGVADT